MSSIGLTTLSSLVNYCLREMQYERLMDSLQNRLNTTLNIHQTMLEESYMSPLRTCSDYLRTHQYKNAANALMDLSNKECTPFVNCLLALILAMNGDKELAYGKMRTAMYMNPFIISNHSKEITERLAFTGVNTMDLKPYELKDSFSNKALRRLGIEINEGIQRVQICTLGGDLSYLLEFSDGVSYGLINLSNGCILWERTEEDSRKQLVMSTPKYTVYKYNDSYEIYSNSNGVCNVRFSKYTFETMFCPLKTLSDYEDFISNVDLNQYSNEFTMPTLMRGKKILILPIKEKEHKYWKTDGNQPHPGIDFDPVRYWAMNVRFRII